MLFTTFAAEVGLSHLEAALAAGLAVAGAYVTWKGKAATGWRDAYDAAKADAAEVEKGLRRELDQERDHNRALARRVDELGRKVAALEARTDITPVLRWQVEHEKAAERRHGETVVVLGEIRDALKTRS